MSTGSLIESLASLATPELISSLSSHLGESPAATQSALGATLPTVLASLAKTASTDGGAQLSSLLQTPGVNASLLNNLPAMLSGGAGGSSELMSLGARLVSTLFGGNTSSIVSTLAGLSGIKGSSMTSLLSLGTPMVLGFLSKHQASSGLSTSALASQLASHKDAITRALPAGVATAVLGTTTHVAPVVVKEKSNKWLWPLVIAGAALLGLMLARGCSTTPVPKAVEVPPTPAVVTPAPVAAPAEVAALPVGRVYFDLDKSDHWVEGGDTIDAVVAYLKSHDTATATISGYHDPSGDVAHNLDLAKTRATAVRDALVAAGISSDRLSLEKPLETTGSADVAREGRRVEITIKP